MSGQPSQRAGWWRVVLLAAAAVPVGGWLLGGVSAVADALASLTPVALPLALTALLPIRAKPSRGQALVGAVLIVVGGMAMGPEVVARWRAPASAPAGGRLVLVTHNVAVANADPEATLRVLLAGDADVLLLQEVNGRFAPMLPRLRARYRWSNACEQRCSLAILSRYPLERVRYRLRDGEGRAFGPPLLQTVLHLPGQAPAPLLTLHLTWPLPPGPQAAARESLAAAVARVPPRRAILTGDFNLTPWSHAMGRLDAALAPMRRVTRALPTYPARQRGVAVAPAFLPIDHVFVGPGWRVVRVERLGRTGSDHYPVRVVLSLPAGIGDQAMAWP